MSLEPRIKVDFERIANEQGSSFQVMRPDYAISSATESSLPLFSSRKFRVDNGSRWVKQKIAGVDYYEVVGYRGLLAGDILLPLGNNNSPKMTMVSVGENDPHYAMRTDLVGTITDGADDGLGVVYSNVRFSFFTLPTVGDGLDSTILGSIGASVRRVVSYARYGIKKGCWLRWTEPGVLGVGTLNKAAVIEAVEIRGTQMILNVTDNPG